jgi:hypothetical protein
MQLVLVTADARTLSRRRDAVFQRAQEAELQRVFVEMLGDQR